MWPYCSGQSICITTLRTKCVSYYDKEKVLVQAYSSGGEVIFPSFDFEKGIAHEMTPIEEAYVINLEVNTRTFLTPLISVFLLQIIKVFFVCFSRKN